MKSPVTTSRTAVQKKSMTMARRLNVWEMEKRVRWTFGLLKQMISKMSASWLCEAAEEYGVTVGRRWKVIEGKEEETEEM